MTATTPARHTGTPRPLDQNPDVPAPAPASAGVTVRASTPPHGLALPADLRLLPAGARAVPTTGGTAARSLPPGRPVQALPAGAAAYRAAAVPPITLPPRPAPHFSGCTLAADASYAARLAGPPGALAVERWTLDGPEPYAVVLRCAAPEAPGTELYPLPDGRVLVHRPVDATAHRFALLYPTGSGTGELPLGSVESPELRLLPPSPRGDAVLALAYRPGSTDLWLVAGGRRGPELLAELPGRCSGGTWLDASGRMLALHRTLDGAARTVTVDLGRGGEVSPLLEIAEGSADRLLLADEASGLMLLSSDAPSPGTARLGWGVLGGTRPVRFPRCLHPSGTRLTPLAVQPGQTLTPENARVALLLERPGEGAVLGIWRPVDKSVRKLPVPHGWLGAAYFSPQGTLHLPCATAAAPCHVVRVPAGAEPGAAPGGRSAAEPGEEPIPPGAKTKPATTPDATYAGPPPAERRGVRLQRRPDTAPQRRRNLSAAGAPRSEAGDNGVPVEPSPAASTTPSHHEGSAPERPGPPERPEPSARPVAGGPPVPLGQAPLQQSRRSLARR